MALTGRALLILGLMVCLYGAGASLYGARTGQREWVDSGRRSVYTLAALMTFAFVILEAAFLRSDFSFNVVAGHSSTTTPTFYKLTAPWSSQEGSLLLWVWLLSLWSSLVLFLTRRRVREIAPYATAVLLGFGAFFSSLAVFYANPFATTANPPAEGAGLDPLLLHPSMMIHPPMLYSGYTLLTIPFAFAIGALITGRLGVGVDRGDAPVRAGGMAVPRHRDPARRPLVLHGARMGRVLGVGSGRERGVDAVAVHHRVHPLDHDPGEAGDAEGVERVAGPCQRDAGDHRHVPRPIGRAGLDPRVRCLDARGPVRAADRGDGGGLDRADRLAKAAAAIRLST